VKEEVICSMCYHLQSFDVEKFRIKMAVATKIFLQDVKFTDYEFICHDCLSTEKYRKDYMSNIEINPHIVLTAKAAIMNKIGAT